MILLPTITSLVLLTASPEICRPYAAQTTEVLIRYAWLRAYYSCLNEDEARPVPSDWYNAMCVVLPNCEFAAPGSLPATEEVVPEPKKKKVWKKRRKRR